MSRKWPRIAMGLGLDLRFQNAAEARHTQTANISREGLFVRMDEPRPIGTKVFLRIEIAEPANMFELEGVVVHSNPDPDDPTLTRPGPHGIGVLLTKASPGWIDFCSGLEKQQS